jgi:hypothetical protein
MIFGVPAEVMPSQFGGNEMKIGENQANRALCCDASPQSRARFMLFSSQIVTGVVSVCFVSTCELFADGNEADRHRRFCLSLLSTGSSPRHFPQT